MKIRAILLPLLLVAAFLAPVGVLGQGTPPPNRDRVRLRSRPAAQTANPPSGQYNIIVDGGALKIEDSTGTATTVGGGGVTTLDGLSDVNTSGAADGHVLTYDGSGWVPEAAGSSAPPGISSGVHWRDEFITYSTNSSGTWITTSGLVGELGWHFAGGPNNPYTSSAAAPGRYGVLTREANLNNEYTYVSLQPNGFTPVRNADTWDATYIWGSGSDITTLTQRIGLANDPAASQPVGFYFEYIDTGNIYAVCRVSGGTATRTDTGVAYATNTYYVGRIRRVDASTIGFSINGGTEITITTNLTSSNLNPFFQCMSGGANGFLHIDAFELTVTGKTRNGA